MKRALGLVLWTIGWPALVLVAAAFSMMGDPVDGGYEQQQLLGRGILLGGAVILLVGYWLILRRRNR